MTTTAIPTAAITPINFHGILAGGPGAGRGTVEVGGATNGSWLRGTAPESSWRSYAARRDSSPSTRYASLISDIRSAEALPLRSG